MGAHLEAPIREKVTDYDQGANVRYVAMAMQGWRSKMEDSHIAHINLEGKGVSVFGVFDGHAGMNTTFFLVILFSKFRA